MPIPLYLTLTAAEFSHCNPLPERIAWMACHFSPSGPGISNTPATLPPESLLILDDSTPITHHDPLLIARQLRQLAADLACAGILLDWERPKTDRAVEILQTICREAPCPVAAPAPYALEAPCAVFLSPPLHIPLTEFLAPWSGREIWLEAAAEDLVYTVTEGGCTASPLPCPPEHFPHSADSAFSRYHIGICKDAIRISFRRSREDLLAMAQQIPSLERMVGLFQQWK